MTLDLHKTLPKTWALIQLGTLTEKVETRNSDFAPDGEFFYIDIASIDNSSNKITSPKKYQWKNAPSRARQVVKENDIVFSTVRTYLMNIALVPPSLSGQIASTGFTVIRARKEIHHKLLFYRTLSREFVEALNELQRGTSYPAVRDRDVFAQFFPLPPLAEQHRIVDKIEELFSDLDAGIASLKKAQQQLKVYRQAVLKWAFEGKLTAEWREEQKRQGKLESAEILLEQIKAEREQRYQTELAAWQTQVEAWEANGKVGKKPGKPKKLKEIEPLTVEEIRDLPELPEGWSWGKLAAITDKITDGEHFRPKITDKGVYFLSAKDIRDHGVSFEDPLFISQETAERAWLRCNPEKGDILIVSRGATVGRMCVIKTDECFCLLGSVILLKVNSCIDSYYLTYILKSPTLNRKLIGVSGSTAQQAIYLRDIQDIPVPLCSTNEQNQIVEEIESRLSICDSFDATITENLQRAEALRQSILKQAFEGKLVPQDPNDEPASVLIERIQAAKASQSNNGKKTRKNREGSTQQELFP